KIEVQDADGKAAFLPYATSLVQGEELAAVARVPEDRPLPRAVRISGTLDGRPYEREIPVAQVSTEAGYLPREWARLRIERLLAEDASKHKEAIIALSKEMYVMTPFTSLLVLENDDMYQQYKVERNRKESWAGYHAPRKIPVVFEPEPGQTGPDGKR